MQCHSCAESRVTYLVCGGLVISFDLSYRRCCQPVVCGLWILCYVLKGSLLEDYEKYPALCGNSEGVMFACGCNSFGMVLRVV